MSNGFDLEEVRRHVDELRAIKHAQKQLTDAEERAKAAIKNALGDHEEGELDGQPVVSWRTSKRMALNQKLLKRLYPKEWAECHEVTEVRTFRILEDHRDSES